MKNGRWNRPGTTTAVIKIQTILITNRDCFDGERIALKVLLPEMKKKHRSQNFRNQTLRSVLLPEKKWDPAFKKVDFKKMDTGIFKEVSFYKKPVSLNKLLSLVHSFILVQIIRN